jgi:hypothetical protein
MTRKIKKNNRKQEAKCKLTFFFPCKKLMDSGDKTVIRRYSELMDFYQVDENGVLLSSLKLTLSA